MLCFTVMNYLCSRVAKAYVYSYCYTVDRQA